MDATSSPHPTIQTLKSHGLGSLDERSTEEVDRHLEICPDCRRSVSELSADSFLGRVRKAQVGSGEVIASSQPGWTQSYVAPVSPSPPPTDTLPPGLAEHPDYEIRRELGRGGMGVVYLAHNRLMGRDEVLKVMGREIMRRPGVLERFLREIRSVARLRHPNIVTAYSAARLGESIVFAMEYVDGLDLSRLVKAKGPLPVAHACNFIHQAALGLQHAHEEGLVHRDVKPANLMLARKGDRATVKVLDFGLAKAALEGELDLGLTSEGQALGTPDYIAPEQILKAPHVDIRADIYSLGGTLFYLLTGRPPFQADSLYDIYQAHISRDADPLNLIRPEVPAELAALVAKMMAKDPARRFQSPGEVARALTPYFKKSSVESSKARAAGPEGNIGETSGPAIGSAATVRTAGNSSRAEAPTPRAAGSAEAKVEWESLIDLHEAKVPSKLVAGTDDRRRPSFVAITASFIGIITLGIIIIAIRDKQGKVTELSVPDDSTIVINGPRENVEFRPRPDPEGATTPTLDPVETPGNVESPPIGELPRPSPEGEGEAEPPGPKPEDTGEGRFESLFNGSDLAGWSISLGDPSNWKVIEGSIRGVAGQVNSTLSTRHSNYDDFELRFEMRTPDVLNKHILFRTSGTPEDEQHYRFVTGGVRNGGDLDPLGGFRYRPGGSHGGGEFDANGLRAIIAPTRSALAKDAWHVIRILAVANVFRMIVDDQEVSAFQDTKSSLSTGRIEFRLRKGSVIELRKIEIRKLKSGEQPREGDRCHSLFSLFNGVDKTNWVDGPSNQGTWTVVDGVLEGQGGDESGQAAELVTTRGDYSNFRLRARIRNDNASRQLLVRWSSDGRTYNGYGVLVGGGGSPGTEGIPLGSINMAKERPVRGSYEWNVRARSVPVRANEWYTMEVSARGNHISTSINGQLVAEFRDISNSFPSGGIALICRPRSTVRFKEIAIEEGATRVDAGGPTTKSTGGPPAKAAKGRRGADALQKGTVWIG